MFLRKESQPKAYRRPYYIVLRASARLGTDGTELDPGMHMHARQRYGQPDHQTDTHSDRYSGSRTGETDQSSYFQHHLEHTSSVHGTIQHLQERMAPRTWSTTRVRRLQVAYLHI